MRGAGNGQKNQKYRSRTLGTVHSGVGTVSLGTFSDKQKWNCQTSFSGKKGWEVLVQRALLLGILCAQKLLLRMGVLHECTSGKEQNCPSLLLLLPEKKESSFHLDTQKLQRGF